MLSRQIWCAAVSVAACGVVATMTAQTSTPAAHPPATSVSSQTMQVPADQAAFQAANAHVDPQERARALSDFLRDFPKSKRAGRARSILLRLLVEQQPQDEKRIHQVAKATVDAAGKDDRASAENSVAYTLAEAPPNGVDLKSAEEWAKDSVKQTTLPAIAAMMSGGSAAAAKPLTPAEQAKLDAQVRDIYNEFKAADLQTLADVYLHEGKLAEATAALDEAQPLNPEQGATFLTRGQIEHLQHQDDKAIADLETATVLGGMTPAGQTLLQTLYAAQHAGNRSGLDDEIDRRYRASYQRKPAAQRSAASSGRTVLLALYTGSACEPCVAADMATDAVLEQYPRFEVVALAFDQHIPDPDPLANAATVARASYDDVRFTPTLRIDGVEGPQIGGRRADAEESFKAISAALDKELQVPSGTKLQVSASFTPDHAVSAKAEFEVTDSNALHKLLTVAAKPATASNDAGSAGAAAPATAAVSTPKLVLNFALVQREVRYSGENGIRFHPMVVRDLARPTADAFSVAPTGSSSASATFHPQTISANLSKYLNDFAKHNDRFGTAHFLSTDTTLPLDQLAVAAWVEDLTSHKVVAASYVPVGEGSSQQASR